LRSQERRAAAVRLRRNYYETAGRELLQSRKAAAQVE